MTITRVAWQGPEPGRRYARAQGRARRRDDRRPPRIAGPGLALALTAGVAAAQAPLLDLGQGLPGGWEERRFDGIPPSRYRVVELIDGPALEGHCQSSASLFGIRQPIDLQRTPILSWSWRVAGTYPVADERSREGDDFPARIYAVRDGGWRPWATRAINYVWASRAEPGTDWPNPFRAQARMVATASGATPGWRHERRDLRADFRRYFDLEIRQLDGIAVMVDCDNHGGEGRAWFRDLRLSPAAQAGAE